MRSLVISIFLYACESWTLTAELEKRSQAFVMRCYRRLLNISYKDDATNEEFRRKIQAAIGEYDELLTLVKKRKLRWFGHVSRSSGLAKTILQGTMKVKRKRGRQKKRWEDTFKEWTGMGFASSTRAAENRSRWKGWLVGCFGLNGPLRQYFSLYRAVSQRGRKKREKIDERKNVQTSTTRTHCKRNRPLPYYNPN